MALLLEFEGDAVVDFLNRITPAQHNQHVIEWRVYRRNNAAELGCEAVAALMKHWKENR